LTSRAGLDGANLKTRQVAGFFITIRPKNIATGALHMDYAFQDTIMDVLTHC